MHYLNWITWSNVTSIVAIQTSWVWNYIWRSEPIGSVVLCWCSCLFCNDSHLLFCLNYNWCWFAGMHIGLLKWWKLCKRRVLGIVIIMQIKGLLYSWSWFLYHGYLQIIYRRKGKQTEAEDMSEIIHVISFN